MKISEKKIREDVKDRLSELENYLDTLKYLKNDLHDKDLIEDIKGLIQKRQPEYNNLENREAKYEEKDKDYLNREYVNDQL